MAEKKISDLTSKDNVGDADEFVFVDKATVSGNDASSTGQTSKITFAKLKTAVGSQGQKGEPGAKGQKGEPGAKGQKGDGGAKGQKGEPGQKGQKGDRGAKGQKGEPGEKGQKGQKGQGDKGQKGEIGTPWSGGTFTNDITVQGDVDGTNINAKTTLSNGNHFFTAGAISYFNASSPNNSHQIRFSSQDADDKFSVLNNSIIQGEVASSTDNGMNFMIANKTNTKSDLYKFRGDYIWLYKEKYDGQNPARLLMSGKASDGVLNSFVIEAYNDESDPTAGRNRRNMVIRPWEVPADGALIQIGSESRPTGVYVWGELNATTKTFRIKHPVLKDKDLLHSCIEGPRADLIYRGVHKLGSGPVNLDKTANMAEGTFVALVRDVQVFVTNNKSWEKVRGRVEGNLLHIECENSESSVEVDWMVVGERNDETYLNSELVDSNGKFITEADSLKISDDSISLNEVAEPSVGDINII